MFERHGAACQGRGVEVDDVRFVVTRLFDPDYGGEIL